MSAISSVVSSPFVQPQPRQTAMQRLAEIQRSLQKQLKRRPTEREKAARDRAAWMLLRAEMAARDPDASANDVVRLSNASRRALADFERVAALPKSEGGTPTLGEILKGGA